LTVVLAAGLAVVACAQPPSHLALTEPGHSSAAWRAVPLTDFTTPWHSATLDIDTDRLATRMRIGSRTLVPEAGVLPLKLLALDVDRVYLIGRTLFDGELRVSGTDLSTGASWPVDLPDDIRRERLFRQAAVFGREIVLVAYHIHDHYSLFVYRFVPDATGRLVFDAGYVRQIAFQGRYEISTPVRMAQADGDLFICGEGFCYRACAYGTSCYGEPLTLIDLGIGVRRLVELAPGQNGQLVGLYQEVEPAAGLPSGSGFTVLDIPTARPRSDWASTDRVPFGLHWRDGRPVTEALDDTTDLTRIFATDVRGGESSGLLNLGENNVEGRVAWSQVYYLSGFITLLQMIEAGEFPAFASMRRELQERVDIEIALWDALLATDTPHMRSKRYTVKRAPALHVVQTGRILRTLKRYRELQTAQPLSEFPRFQEQVRTLEGHLEAARVASPGDRWLPAGRRNLWWPRGSAFPTFDGVTIPFNHMDDWAGGVLYGESADVRDEEFALIARDSLQILLDEEFSGGLPENYRWDYWFGQVEAGWTDADRVSVHMPTYKGERYHAHVSYLTIDMMALLSVGRVYPEILPEGILDYLVEAVERGALYPFLSEDLAAYGRHPAIPEAIALGYLRPDSAGGLQSSIWAYRTFSRPLS